MRHDVKEILYGRFFLTNQRKEYWYKRILRFFGFSEDSIQTSMLRKTLKRQEKVLGYDKKYYKLLEEYKKAELASQRAKLRLDCRRAYNLSKHRKNNG